MSSSQQSSAACHSIPPVIAKNYQYEGTYQIIDGLKTYATGPADAAHGILIVARSTQTLQGADILAYANNQQPSRVFMPDWLDGNHMPVEWYPPDTDDKKQKLEHFPQTKAEPPVTVAKIPGVTRALNELAPKVQRWGILGFCWGAKIFPLCSIEKTAFSVAAEVHPALVDRNDASEITIPIVILASQDEDPLEIEAFKSGLRVENHVEIYGDQAHGWMGARADLEKERSRSEYERGYKRVLT